MRQLKKLLAQNLGKRAAQLSDSQKKANRRKSRRTIVASNQKSQNYEDTAINMSMLSSMHSLNGDK